MSSETSDDPDADGDSGTDSGADAHVTCRWSTEDTEGS
jgi:hypothetical protein